VIPSLKKKTAQTILTLAIAHKNVMLRFFFRVTALDKIEITEK
jgi:hypothetical protein